MNKFILKLSN